MKPIEGFLMGKTSRYKRYRDGMWLPARKTVYLYWFKFLKRAEKSKRHKVDWSRYEEWNCSTNIENLKFDPWWEKNWRRLFAVHKLDDTPLFPITTKAPKPDSYRIMLMVYDHRELHPNKSFGEIADSLSQIDSSNFYASITTAEQYDARRVYVFRHLQRAEQIIENVASGIFPGNLRK